MEIETGKITVKEKFVKELRALADFVEEKDFDFEKKAPSSVTFYVWCTDKKDFAQKSKLLGSFKKSADNWLNATKSFGDFVNLQVTITREYVCKKVKVGTKIIPATEKKIVPEQIIPAEPEKEVEVYEYKCPESFIDLENEEDANENI